MDRCDAMVDELTDALRIMLDIAQHRSLNKSEDIDVIKACGMWSLIADVAQHRQKELRAEYFSLMKTRLETKQ